MTSAQTIQSLNLFAQICKALNAVQFKINGFIQSNLRNTAMEKEVAAKKQLAKELNDASDKACSAYDNNNIELLKDVLSFVVAKSNA